MLDYPLLFVERLGENDLRMLAGLQSDATTPTELRRRLADDPGEVESLLADPRTFEVLFESPESDVMRVLTPSLAFGVLVHKTIRDLETTSHVSEWVGAGERLPVFDVHTLREFIGDTSRRFVVIELLSSFTRVSSGSRWVRTQRGYRRRRFSELDPSSLAEMVGGLPLAHRAAGYRRLGDVALFLTGVFPDHTSRHPLSEMRRARLVGSTGLRGDWDQGGDYVHFLEGAGRRWYDRAASGLTLPGAGQQTLQDMAANFTQARRFLNYLGDTYLHRIDTGLMNPVG